MIFIENALIEKIVTHFVGNKSEDEGIILSNSPISLTEELASVLKNYLLSEFQSEMDYQFYHETAGVGFNVVYSQIRDLFLGRTDIMETSIGLAKFLYEQCDHNMIKSGEFHTVLFRDIIIDGEEVDAVGLYKTDDKDTFLQIVEDGDSLGIEAVLGINTHKLDKGCLIINRNEDEGFVVKIVDNTNRSEAKYWVDEFLKVKVSKTGYTNTQNVMSMTKKFVTKQLPKEYEVTKSDQIDLLNKSLEFFKENDSFDMDQFASSVMGEHPGVAESFLSFKDDYQKKNDLVIDDCFDISEEACKKQQRSYRRIIKLDRKIQIVIDGNQDQIVHGEDEYGKFYKVYYTEETI
ncbi:MAG: nucleoid-associated protein [Bacteroidales bacterium]|nr:nucleoid-associated protein [Bacteroidales bacterium]